MCLTIPKSRSIAKMLQNSEIAIGITAGRCEISNRAIIERVMREQGRWACTDFGSWRLGKTGSGDLSEMAVQYQRNGFWTLKDGWICSDISQLN